MQFEQRQVAIKQVPQSLTKKQWPIFLRELESCTTVYRPYVVLDCSTLAQMDGAVIDFLLFCLVNVLKRNGDVRLAGVSPRAVEALESTGVDRLFKIYESNIDAVRSFHRGAANIIVNAGANEGSHEGAQRASGNAA